MLDLAVEERLESEFQLLTRSPEEDIGLTEFVKTGHALPSQSDAGAHLNTNFCTAGESSYVLSEWVRERQLLSLEDAISRLTFQPARIVGLYDRGLVREGMAADLVVLDPATVGPRMPEVVNDLPAGAKRLKQTADGIKATVVNGQVLLRDNRHTGALPGKLIRGRVPQ